MCVEDVAKRERRNLLLEKVEHLSWFPIEHHNIKKFTRKNWFKSLPLWIAMQRKIDEFNTNVEQRDDRKEKRKKIRAERRCKSKQPQPQTQPKPKPPENDPPKPPPKVKNLAVIPICSFRRTHVTIDNFTLYKILCKLRIVPKTPGKRVAHRNIKFKEFMAHKEWCWNQYFYMRKIKWFVRRKKKFRFRFLSDGQAVSLAYDVEQRDFQPLDKEAIVERHDNGGFGVETAIDPGDKTWIAAVQRDIETQKEVNSTPFSENSIQCCIVMTLSKQFFLVSFLRSISRYTTNGIIGIPNRKCEIARQSAGLRISMRRRRKIAKTVDCIT